MFLWAILQSIFLTKFSRIKQSSYLVLKYYKNFLHVHMNPSLHCHTCHFPREVKNWQRFYAFDTYLQLEILLWECICTFNYVWFRDGLRRPHVHSDPLSYLSLLTLLPCIKHRPSGPVTTMWLSRNLSLFPLGWETFTMDGMDASCLHLLGIFLFQQ